MGKRIKKYLKVILSDTGIDSEILVFTNVEHLRKSLRKEHIDKLFLWPCFECFFIRIKKI